MDWLLQALIIFGMFVLRLGVPLAITVAVGYWLHRLDAKWQAEAQAQQEAFLAQQEDRANPEIEILKVIKEPCWVTKGCPETIYKQCPAYRQPNIPCWMARFRVEEIIPSKCYQCTLFSRRQAKKYFSQDAKHNRGD